MVIVGYLHKRDAGIENATYLISEYRSRYYENKNSYYAIAVLNEFDKLADHDHNTIKILKKAAEQGDTFALAALAFSSYAWSGLNRTDKILKAATAGDAMSDAIYGYIMYKGIGLAENKPKGMGYITKAIDSGNFYGYYYLLEVQNFDIPIFCNYLKKGYETFGLELFSDMLINNDPKLAHIEEKCSLFGAEQSESILDSIKSEESEYIKGIVHLKKQNYQQAAKIFFELRTAFIDKIAINSRYCLGVMHTEGLGVIKNQEKGSLYLKNAFDNGQILYGTKLGEMYTFPQRPIIMNHTASAVCASANN